jgi:uncharacterized protein (DUF1330 family)
MLHDFRSFQHFGRTISPSDKLPLLADINENRGKFWSKTPYCRKGDAMPAYVITEIEVTDPEGYEEYRSKVGKSLEAFGAKFLVRGGEIDVLEGDWQPKRIVMCVFDSMDKARQWYDSDAYCELKKVRENTASMSMVAVEGI